MAQSEKGQNGDPANSARDDDGHKRRSSPDRHKQSDTPLPEWIVAIIGFLLVASTIGYLLYEAVAGDPSPPSIVIKVGSVHPTANGFLVMIEAFNHGGSTAEGVIVEGVITEANQSVERSETTIDYLPSRSSVKGGLFFSKDPQQFHLEVRPKGFEEP